MRAYLESIRRPCFRWDRERGIMRGVDKTDTNQDTKSVLTPKLRFPAFRNAPGWEKKQLGPYLEDQSSRAPSNTNLPVFSSTREGLKRQDTYFDGRVLMNENDYGVVPPGCFVYRHMSDDGLFKFNINETGAEIAVSKEYPVFSTKNLNSAFLLAKLNEDPDFRQFALSQKAGGTRTRLYFSKLCEWRTPLPSLAEQQKIAECLSSLDEVIAAESQTLDALKTHKKGLMQQLFPREGETVPRLRFPDFKNAGDWEKKLLGEICQIQRGKFSHRPRNDPRFFGGKYPFIQTGDVVKSNGGPVEASQSLNELGLSVSKLFKPTIVLVTIAANIGDTGILDREACFTDSVVGLIPNTGINPYFLELTVRGKKEYLNKIAPAAAQKNINNEILSVLPVLVPPLAEQQKIADCLTSLDDLITAQSQRLEALKTHKRGLMQQLFPSQGSETDSTMPTLRLAQGTTPGRAQGATFDKLTSAVLSASSASTVPPTATETPKATAAEPLLQTKTGIKQLTLLDSPAPKKES